jgi:hypothetical protein
MILLCSSLCCSRASIELRNHVEHIWIEINLYNSTARSTGLAKHGHWLIIYYKCRSSWRTDGQWTDTFLRAKLCLIIICTVWTGHGDRNNNIYFIQIHKRGFNVIIVLQYLFPLHIPMRTDFSVHGLSSRKRNFSTKTLFSCRRLFDFIETSEIRVHVV